MSNYTATFGAIMAKHDARLFTVELPELKPNEILVRMEAINICTTDYQQWMGLRDHYGFPMADGHEFCGIIVEKGEDVRSELQIGDRIGQGYRGCGCCPACRSGYESECTDPRHGVTYAPDFLGGKAFANYKIMDSRSAYKLSKSITAAEAAFLEPVSTVVQCVRHARIQPTETVVVIGAGTMGLANAQVAKAWGARVIISDLSEKKVERAKSMNIGEVINASKEDPVAAVMDLTGGVGADVVIAAAASSAAYRQGIQMLRHFRGRFVIFPAGYPKPALEVDPNEIHYRKMEIIGSFEATDYDFLLAARLLNYRLIDMKPALEGAPIPLRDINEAFSRAATPDSYRITVDLQQI